MYKEIKGLRKVENKGIKKNKGTLGDEVNELIYNHLSRAQGEGKKGKGSRV